MSLLTGLQKLDNCHCNSLICTRAFDIRSIIEAMLQFELETFIESIGYDFVLSLYSWLYYLFVLQK